MYLTGELQCWDRRYYGLPVETGAYPTGDALRYETESGKVRFIATDDKTGNRIREALNGIIEQDFI